MVYCPQCGADNEEDTEFCVKCGAALSVYRSRGGRRREKRDECFGLPHGGAIFGLFIGIIIILWGARELLGWSIDIGAFAIIIIGLLVVAGAIYGFTRKGR